MNIHTALNRLYRLICSDRLSVWSVVAEPFDGRESEPPIDPEQPLATETETVTDPRVCQNTLSAP